MKLKRSRAFVLSEQLMTIMLQAGFILVLCTSFYQLISFYTRTQQVLTARSHAERVISFMDDKIRSAGLGLWRCKNSSDIRSRFAVTMLATQGPSKQGYRLPIALKWYSDGLGNNTNDIPSPTKPQDKGDVLTLLYAQRSLSSGAEETISAFRASSTLDINGTATLKLLDANDISSDISSSESNPKKVNSLFSSGSNEQNIKTYAVMEGFGFPIRLTSVPIRGSNIGQVEVMVYSTQPSQSITIPAAGELLSLNCMQMFVQGTDGSGEGRQFAFRELKDTGDGWKDKYNQEKGILDIYMEVDRDKNIFTLWVLASGGYDASLNNPRPDSWPKEANPKGNTDAAAKTAWLSSDYCHHIVYVSRASWKLNNIPPNFAW